MVNKSKAQKKQKRGVDFKKIKRKIGRKLPPAQNATNTEIKSKAIILPEQSVASEKAGLAVSKKGLTLKELLQQTGHHNAKVRKDALIGIRDVLLKFPAELKLHKLAVIEKLRERISDDDKLVRETLYQLLKSVIFPGCKEDNKGPINSLMMTYILNAMTNMAIEVRLMAFKFFDLLIQYFPSSFLLYAEKILQNYEDILQKNKFYLQDKGRLKNALAGLVRCLSLLPCSNQKEGDSLSDNIQKKPSAYGVSFPVPNIMQKWTLVVTFLWRACYIFPRYFLLYFSSVFPSFLGVGWLDCSVNLLLIYCNLPLITAKLVLYCASSYFPCKLLPFGAYSFIYFCSINKSADFPGSNIRKGFQNRSGSSPFYESAANAPWCSDPNFLELLYLHCFPPHYCFLHIAWLDYHVGLCSQNNIFLLVIYKTVLLVSNLCKQISKAFLLSVSCWLLVLKRLYPLDGQLSNVRKKSLWLRALSPAHSFIVSATSFSARALHPIALLCYDLLDAMIPRRDAGLLANMKSGLPSNRRLRVTLLKALFIAKIFIHLHPWQSTSLCNGCNNFSSFFFFLLLFVLLFIESNFSLIALSFSFCTLQDGDRYFTLNIAITEIFLQLSYGSKLSPALLERFLEFIESSLSEKMSVCQYITLPVVVFKSIPPYVLNLAESRVQERFAAYLPDCGEKWSALCSPSLLNSEQDWLYLDPKDLEIFNHQIAWIRELPKLLVLLGDKHPLHAKAVLRLQLRLGQAASLNGPLAKEYDNMQHIIRDFYCTCLNGTVSYGPFMRLPRDIQELSICCLYYFSFLDTVLLQPLVSCCICKFNSSTSLIFIFLTR
uniref:Testis-expressed sequence 10 protein homolog n=1 Tax=Nicotiana tabacum TaxID=4097 RepID=A0A1S4BQ53_TOBAC|nr:PREDICTED: uncharacterized protein LOC107810706 [Nicotiana tabacum]